MTNNDKWKNEILDKLYRSDFMEDLLDNITSGHPLKADLKQELFLILADMGTDKIIQAHQNNYLNYLCINILKKQYHSSNSKFHKHWRKDKYKPLDFDIKHEKDNRYIEEQKKVDKIKEIVDTELSLTDRELFKMYFKFDNYDRYFGKLRDTKCNRPISSTRKIENKLELKKLPGSKKISIDHSTIALSIKNSLKLIRNRLDEEKPKN